MISRLLFNLRCTFDYSFAHMYNRRLDMIYESMFSAFSYTWEDFMLDVNSISEDYNIPVSYVFQDLRDIMPDS